MDDFSTRIATRKKRSRDFFVFKLLDPAVCINRFAAPKHHETAAGHSLDAIAFPVRNAEPRPDQLTLGVVGCVRHRRVTSFRLRLCARPRCRVPANPPRGDRLFRRPSSPDTFGDSLGGRRISRFRSLVGKPESAKASCFFPQRDLIHLVLLSRLLLIVLLQSLKAGFGTGNFRSVWHRLPPSPPQ
jgi:hypothetical protein